MNNPANQQAHHSDSEPSSPAPSAGDGVTSPQLTTHSRWKTPPLLTRVLLYLTVFAAVGQLGYLFWFEPHQKAVETTEPRWREDAGFLLLVEVAQEVGVPEPRIETAKSHYGELHRVEPTRDPIALASAVLTAVVALLTLIAAFTERKKE